MVPVQCTEYRYRVLGTGYRVEGTGLVCWEKYALLLPSSTISVIAPLVTKPNHISNCHIGFVQKSNIQVVVLSVLYILPVFTMHMVNNSQFKSMQNSGTRKTLSVFNYYLLFVFRALHTAPSSSACHPYFTALHLPSSPACHPCWPARLPRRDLTPGLF